jgi:hypothetical protein
MKVNQIIARAKNSISIKNVLIRNANMKTLLYFGSTDKIPSQLVNKEVTCYLYNPSRELFILKITT